MDGPWKVYFELNGKTNDDVVKFLQDNVDTKSLWYIHPSGKVKGPHCHGLIWNHAQTDETLRKKIKKCFNLTEKKQFGISNTFENKTKMSEDTVPPYIKYMSKGQFDPLYNIGYDDEYVNERKREWKPDNAIRITGDLTVITQGTVTKKRITQVTIATMVIERWNAGITLENAAERYSDNVDYKKLYKMTRRLLIENNMSCNYRQMANILQDISARLDPERHMLKVLSMV